MLNKTAVYCTKCLILEGVIEQKREDIYIYGFELLLSTISSILSMIFISIITENFVNGILFLLVFMPLRMTANGYHAKTFFKCFILTNSIFILYIYMIGRYSAMLIMPISIVIFIISVIYIYLKAPVEHPNHILKEIKRKQNRWYAHIILGIDCLAIFLMYITGWRKAAYSLYISIVLVAGMMIIKNQKEE